MSCCHSGTCMLSCVRQNTLASTPPMIVVFGRPRPPTYEYFLHEFTAINRPIIMESKSKMGLWTESQLSSFGLASIPAISGCPDITDRLRRSDRVSLVKGSKAPALRHCRLAARTSWFSISPEPTYFDRKWKPIFDYFRVARECLPLSRLIPVLACNLCHSNHFRFRR